jgi:hypothetical protein
MKKALFCLLALVGFGLNASQPSQQPAANPYKPAGEHGPVVELSSLEWLFKPRSAR